MKTAASVALGCKVNQYESEAIGEMFAAHGYELVDCSQKADVYIINTCTVTNLGDKKSRQLIRRVKRQNPDAIVAVVGCYAQTAPNEVMAVEGVNLVVGTKDRNQLVSLVEGYVKEWGVKNVVSDIMQERTFEPLSIGKLKNRTRAYLKIQDGCTQYCSYCIIPYARGPVRSRPLPDIIEEVVRLSQNGFQEVVLTGIHVASYGRDLEGVSLLDVIAQVSQVEGIRRIRFSSIEPNIVTEEFAKALSAYKKVCHHFHLSLQSGSDNTLKEMNRKYTADMYRKAAARLRTYFPDVALTTDIIVGFPGETHEDFLESLEFAKEMEFSKIHVFSFSPKKGTPAAKRKDQIPADEKAARSRQLIALSKDMGKAFLEKAVAKRVDVLFEQETAKGIYEGHTSNYMKVRASSQINIQNQELSVQVTKAFDEDLFGEICWV